MLQFSILSFLCTVAITCSLGEIASAYPTAGGQYHWVAALSPRSTRSVAAWITGWISIGGQVVFTASAAFAAALQIQGLVVLNHSDYVPERYQGTLLYCLILFYGAAMNIWGSKLLPHVNLLSGVVHVGGFVAIFITLGVMAPKNAPSFVFAEVINSSGWENLGVSWLVGLISTVYPFLGYDAACHLAEELPDASRNVPIAMIGSTVLNGIIGFGYCIMLLFLTGPLDLLLSTPTGFPYMQIFLNATGTPVGAALLSFGVFFTAVAATVAGITSTSRTLWAFARDDAIPFYRHISRVDANQTPTAAIAVSTLLQVFLGFIYLGNPTAFNAILAMSIIGMYLSYLLPIVYMLLFGRRNLDAAEYGPFRLHGPLGVLLNLVSIAWLTAANFNYSSVVMAGWVLFGVVYYLVWGHKSFKLPLVGSRP